MRPILLIFITLLGSALLRADEPVQVPKGIRYKETTPAINDAARELLRQRFSAKATDDDVKDLFIDNLLICGPGLWRDVKEDKDLSKITHGKVELRIPVRAADGTVSRYDKMDGKVFQSSDEVLVFWKAFIKRADLDNLTIRKLNEEELKIFWAMIPFDITEPIFIMESEKHKFLVMFLAPRANKPNEKLKIMWIDDYQNLTIRDKSKTAAASDK